MQRRRKGILGFLTLSLDWQKGGGRNAEGLALLGGMGVGGFQIPPGEETAADWMCWPAGRHATARVNAAMEDAAKAERGCGSRGVLLADLMEGETRILKREGRL